MTTLANNFDGGTSGTTVTTGNSGGSSGDAFNSVTTGTAATIAFDNAQAHSGTLALKAATGATSTTTFVQWTLSDGVIWGRVYSYSTTATPANTNIIRFLNTTSTILWTIRENTNQKLAFLYGSGTLGGTGATSFTLNAWVRYEFCVDAANGNGWVALFNTTDSESPSEVISTVAKSFGATSSTIVRLGIVANQANYVASFHDDFKVDTAEIGPTTGKTAGARVATVSRNSLAGAVSSISVNKPTGTVDGDLLVAIQWQDKDAATGGAGGLTDMTAPAGWTTKADTSALGAAQANSGYGKVYYKVASGEGSSYSFGMSNQATCMVAIHRIVGANTTSPWAADPVYTATAATGSNITSYVTPSLTMASSGLQVRSVNLQGVVTATTFANPAGYWGESSVDPAPFQCNPVSYKPLTASGSTGTQNLVVSGSNGSNTLGYSSLAFGIADAGPGAPTPATVAGTTTVPAVQIAQVATPATVAGVTAVDTATVTLPASVSATTVAGSTQIPAPIVITAISPTTVTGTASVGAPTVQLSRTANATTVAGVTTISAPAAMNATPAPATVAGATTIGSPTVTTGGGATVSAVTVAGVATVPAVSVRKDVAVSATTVAGSTTVPAPTVQTQGNATVSASTVAGIASVPAVTVVTQIQAITVQGTTQIQAPTVTGSTQIQPATVQGAASIATPTILRGQTVSAVTVAGVTAIGTPSVSTGGGVQVSPTTVAGSTSIPTPVVPVNVAITASTVAGVASVGSPVVRSAAQVSAITVAGSTQIPAVTVIASSSVTVLPGTVQGTTAIGAVQIATAGQAIPATVAGVTTIGPHTPSASAKPVCGTVVCSTSIATPIVSINAKVGPVPTLLSLTTVGGVLVLTSTPAPATTRPGGWYSLLDIYKEADSMMREDLAMTPLACPNDGEPLLAGPNGEIYCPFDGWRAQ